MKVNMTFNGSLSELSELSKNIPLSTYVSATIEYETNVKTLTERCREAALPWIEKLNKINAIKAVREVSGMGLKESKDFVEAMPECVEAFKVG